jgi:hypothetical protein
MTRRNVGKPSCQLTMEVVFGAPVSVTLLTEENRLHTAGACGAPGL